VFHEKGPTLLELAEQALSSTDRGYDLLAPKFDYTPFRTPDPVIEAVVHELGGPGSVERGLDVCCGTGAAMRWLRPLCTKEVVGIDRSEGMLAEAEKRLAGAPGIAQLRFVRGDALEMPFESEFDVAVSFGAFGHILEKDEPRLVASIHRALRPGGRFAFVTTDVPKKTNLGYWLAKGFNAAMHVRNALISPPFIMYYLTFLYPRARALLEEAGFEVEMRRGVCPRPFHPLLTVIATKKP
jgi:ubiquinone/menaquinone biosynthesis C-methylase UbiE